VRYLFVIILLWSSTALACDPIRIGGGKSDAERQKEILSPNNPNLEMAAKITTDDVRRKILLAVLASFKVDPIKVDFKKSVYVAPLCMDDLDFMELVLEAEDLFNIKVSDKELESITSKGRAAISLGSLEWLIKSKL
jgi:acyl carrier protein